MTRGGRTRETMQYGIRRDILVVYPHLWRYWPFLDGLGSIFRFRKNPINNIKCGVKGAISANYTRILCAYRVKNSPKSSNIPQVIWMNAAHFPYHNKRVQSMLDPQEINLEEIKSYHRQPSSLKADGTHHQVRFL